MLTARDRWTLYLLIAAGIVLENRSQKKTIKTLQNQVDKCRRTPEPQYILVTRQFGQKREDLK